MAGKMMELIKTETKMFLWKDKTGRGFTSKIYLNDILQLEGEQDYFDNPLHEWAESADEGDEWETREMKFICL